MPEQGLIRLQGVSKDYRIGEVTVHALRNIDFEITAGEFVFLLGPSVCGKTTKLPEILGDLAAGAFVNVTLKYHMPIGVSQFTTTTCIYCQDDGGHDYWYPGPLS
ncbi:MAG: hypothetical protein JJD96_07895 [Thermoleophilia bacterium]|nr:hypothetical protein [Thermoleophilia bacterium]